MVNETKFSAVLSDFVGTLGTDFPIQAILDHLVGRIVDVLPVTAAGVTLISDDLAPRFIASSDAAALCYEQLQAELAQGPCLSAYTSGEPVSVPDLRTDSRYPAFGPAAVAEGLAAVFTFPLRQGTGLLGALDLYRDSPGDLSARDMDVAQTLANVAAAFLLNAQAREDAVSSATHFQHLALHDALTGLPNRLLLKERLNHAARRAQRSRSYAAVLFVDLDRFKRVNDTYGHRVGDEVLLAVADRLAPLIRTGDTLARVSGDEFVLLCEDLASPADAELISTRIRHAFSLPYVAAGVEIALTASVGMAFAGPGELISESLVEQADVAMYQAKRAVGAAHGLRDGSAGKAAVDSVMASDLRKAVDDNALDLAYQPIVRTADGVVTGVEALLRWTRPGSGPISAASAVALAERFGLIVDIGAWVLDRICRDWAQWRQRRPGPALDIAVNVSVDQLLDERFSHSVEGTLIRTGMDPAALVLEVTESILIDKTERVVVALHRLKKLGVRISLDDFGSGYSSLSYLSRLPIDVVKIDQGFIADINDGQPGGAIAAAVTNLAHALGLAVVAEGVQTSKQHEAVAGMGCDCAQGYFYARPMPASAIAGMPTVLDAAPRVTVPATSTPALKAATRRPR